MTEYASVNGNRIAVLRLKVGNQGPWVAECDFDSDPEISGSVVIKVNGLELTGTVDEQQNAVFGAQRKCRVVAGAGAWGNPVVAKNYHNDAGVKARTVADDAAREVGESIGVFVPVSEAVGIDYVRQAGSASRALENVLGGASWWVDFKGKTNVGTRNVVEADKTLYEVLAFDPKSQVVTLAVESPTSVSIGSILSENLPFPLTIREFELQVGKEDLRVVAWCGGSESSYGRLSGLLKSIITRTTNSKVYGKYEYRVYGMSVDRVDLQIVRKGSGLPDLLPVSMWPGIPGVHAELTPGTIVLVEFIEGDPARPIITHFSGKDGTGFVPVSITIGGEAGSPAARSGDTVEVLLPPAIFSGTIGGAPASGVLTFPLSKTLGTISSGSSKVNIAT